MSTRICTNGHQFEKTSSCPVCPICSKEEMSQKFGEHFPKLGAPAYRALAGIGVKSLDDVTRYSEEELLALHGFGPKALRILRASLAREGKMFKQ